MPAPKVNRRQMMLGMGAATLVGGVSPTRPMSDGALLLANIAPRNRYQRDFHAFLTELCYSQDEARGGEVRKFPDWPLFRDLTDDLMTESLLFWNKSRRCMATWVATAFSVWVLAGGSDSRWVALTRSRRNRQIVLASRKLEDVGGSAYFLRERVRWMVEDLENRNIREHWPDFPEFTWTFSEGRASNNSRISAVPQGKDQWRGSGVTLGWMEEVSSWSEAQQSIEAAKMCCQGGGKILAISTSAVGTYAADLVLDRIGQRGWS